MDNAWVHDIQCHHSVTVLAEFLLVWDMVQEVAPQPEVDDVHRWRFEASGKFSTNSAYEAFFVGSILFEPSQLIWSN